MHATKCTCYQVRV